MESTPSLFAGTVFALFGAALLVWAGARTARRAPVTQGGSAAGAALTTLIGTLSLVTGVWCLVQA
ncbi:hypothetical protein QMK19_35840 [Streptomyces sp. H10-C2]|uniref:hypothetical protein n=1 Tax=unclassified Streptomyces TaxID=2593676 RepID=UPI0024BAA156|nr:MULTISPECIES: hypothetical protein [unclassified Streptomyces]MDJ0346166.1 hypothetical protein [Streptomyces sp. PH10-H1]MDJ0374849.1 hypothetical protein [Streptomyces sp. H10-C2]